ncbi:hypothetical protein OGAPHI_000896 [Ogataea philodendri]|uniref:Zn(2)-C6 fungal-type domain-containing protein n=1 Tax=Ogataea philodendri TaxID=1378263 RepID=A0A9P8T914_9ASCO|nr:uncharacterized protein OGAPHI_000896 [Ogataea philodendri]KAH3670381.1 hypothetical protein OGAPHI_000896 [Ogataea philodendri]
MSIQGRQRQRASVACLECRNRKIKCDLSLKHPCSSCLKHNLECQRSSKDFRKERHDSKYIRDLEERLKDNTHLFDQLKSQIALLSDTISGISRPEKQPSKPVEKSHHENVQYPWTDSFPEYKNQSLSVYGPTSIFDSVNIPNSEINEVDQLKMLNSDTEILECIKLFFQWLYPDLHCFLYREAFLLDFFHPKKDFSYCSKELVLSICSIGALLSSNDKIKEKSLMFYDEARESLLKKLNHPTLTSLQSFLLLGLYDIYSGRNNGGWMLSGSGLRMGYNLGFQLSPKSWNVGSKHQVNETNLGIRSRVLWGSYLADHFISLILGRPSVLKMSQTTIEECETMPNIEWIDEFTYKDPRSDETPEEVDIVNPLKAIVDLINITEYMLLEIFTGAGPLDDHSFEISDKLKLLQKYNEELIEWKARLPENLHWTPAKLETEGCDPTKMVLKYFYYIVLLCLNRPFISLTRESPESIKICQDVISELHIAITQFTSIHGFRKCSILIIYSCILSISVILLSSKRSVAEYLHQNPITRQHFFDFMVVLEKSGETWKLSEKSYAMIRSKLSTNYEFDYDSEYAAYLKSTPPYLDNYKEPDWGTVPLDNSFGGPPLFMTSEVFDNWESLFPDYTFNDKL